VAHSFGSQLATYFAAIFPGFVELLIVIDSMEPRPVPLDTTLQHLRAVAEQHFELDKKLANGESPVYTYDQVFQKTQKNGMWPLCVEATKDLLKRSITPYKNGYRFVADQRLKYPMRPTLTFEQQTRILESVACPVLFILSEGNMERYKSYLKEVYEYNSTKRDREIVVVDGDHAVHQNYPERVSSLVNKKIFEYENKHAT
jgi:pimeloyl-ACP methyl ester carboxylesterase